MDNPIFRRFSIAAFVSVLAMSGACTSIERTSAEDVSSGDDCMVARTLRDWRPLDNQNLILFGSGRVPYHVELVRPAFGLTYDIMIGVYDRDGRICPYGGDAIILDGPMPERVSIRNMKRLNDAELERLYVEHGISPPPVMDEFEEVPADQQG